MILWKGSSVGRTKKGFCWENRRMMEHYLVKGDLV